jgi:8-oxo-dGTP pyrophosphatase MutT (NUDIX family)
MQPPNRSNPWTVLRKEETFSCSHFSVRSDIVQFGNSLPRTYNSVRMKSIGVIIAPIDDAGCTILVGQYRYAMDCFTWELPAGGCGLDQVPVEAAKHELSEETGYAAAHLDKARLALWLAILAPAGTFVVGSMITWAVKGFHLK